MASEEDGETMEKCKAWNLDKLTQIYGLKRHVTAEDYDAIVKRLAGPDEQRKLKELESSLGAEEEFMLISQVLGKCISINKIDQRKFKSTKRSIPPDLIATYARYHATTDRPEDKITMFIEVKTCHSQLWRISESDLDNRCRYATLNNLPLWFAIRFELHGMDAWCLLPADYVARNKRKVHLARVWNSPFDLLLGNTDINLMELTSTTVWEKSNDEASITHKDFGNLVKTTIDYSNETYEYPGSDPRSWMFRHFMSEEVSVERNWDRTVVCEHFPRQIKPLYKLMIEFAQRTQSNPQGRTLPLLYDRIVTDSFLSTLTPAFFLSVLRELENCGLMLTFMWDPVPNPEISLGPEEKGRGLARC